MGGGVRAHRGRRVWSSEEFRFSHPSCFLHTFIRGGHGATHTHTRQHTLEPTPTSLAWPPHHPHPAVTAVAKPAGRPTARPRPRPRARLEEPPRPPLPPSPARTCRLTGRPAPPPRPAPRPGPGGGWVEEAAGRRGGQAHPRTPGRLSRPWRQPSVRAVWPPARPRCPRLLLSLPAWGRRRTAWCPCRFRGAGLVSLVSRSGTSTSSGGHSHPHHQRGTGTTTAETGGAGQGRTGRRRLPFHRPPPPAPSCARPGRRRA